MRGPLVTAAVILAAILIVRSFAAVALPDSLEIIGIAAGIVAIAAILVMVVMFFRMKGTQ